MGADLPVRLATPATEIDWGGDGVAVETPAGTIRARACIVTVSTGVLQAGSIRFAPALPGWKQDAIDNLPMGLLAKVALRFDGERFGLGANQWLTYRVPEETPTEACYFLTFPLRIRHHGRFHRRRLRLAHVGRRRACGGRLRARKRS